ncbi:hypothetical protein [Bacterioplanoides sp.]|uniref:hypothetical protein n=1 Tax=Bacterioplanoides sp. TaxID=2066072 RepID=UPI003B5C8D57
MNTQKHIHHGLALVSFGMTGLFGFSLASGVTALLFAVSMVLIQAAALLFMPERFIEAKNRDSGGEMALYGGVIVAALLLSMVASVATLSGSYEKSASARAERASLQAAMDGYIESGYITKGLEVRKQIEMLPEFDVTPLASAAERVEVVTGISGSILVTAFITLLAFLLDLAVMLTNSHAVTRNSNVRYSVPEPVTQDSNAHYSVPEPVTQDSNAHYSVTEPVAQDSNAHYSVTEPVAQDSNAHYSVTEPVAERSNDGHEIKRTVTDESPLLEQTTPEVRVVAKALNDGIIKKPSVREIRMLLRCSQNHAAQIARNCRQLELSI